MICHRVAWPVVVLTGCCVMLTELAWPARAAVTESWVHRYSNVVSNSNDQAVKVVRDAAGDIIVTGNTEGAMLTIKYSGADGSVLWQKGYSGPPNGDAYASAMAADGSGNVVVAGSSGEDFYTAKYAAADGALLWEKRYNGPANRTDYARAVAVDGTGNVIVAGLSYNAPPNYGIDYCTVKYAAADGAMLWEKRYNGPANVNEVRAVAVDGSGNVVVTGTSQNSSLNYDYYTAKYAVADGALIWDKRYNGPANGYDEASAVAVDGSGNVVVTGTSAGGLDSGGYSIYDYYTAKYAAVNGALLWEKRYTNGGASAVAVDSSGNVVVTGSSSSGTNFTNGDYYTAKYAAADGALLWEKRYNGPGNDYYNHDYASALAVDANGDVVVTGQSLGNGGYDYYTAKYAAADGVLLWEKRYNGPANNNDFAQALAVDGSGNVVVTGSSGYEDYWGEYYDYYTAKYAAADGALLWEKRYNGEANREDSAHAVAVDTSGNVVVTGISFGNGSANDYYTAKYAVADGALLWEKRYNGPANWYDSGQAVAVDGSGNVVVTGGSSDGGHSDYYTAKYAAADGALLWERRCNGCGSATAVAVDGSGNVVVTGDSATIKYLADGTEVWTNYAGANALALDSSGNVAVTGTSWNTNFTNPDYYTAKYAAADGALLWEKRYNGPGNDYDFASAVALDGSGNVVVTGQSYGNGSSADYYTAKYAAADGVLLWEKRYNGPANLDDRANAVAVDGSGNAVVTGSSYNGTNADYYTAKYAAATGTLLWEKHSNGGGQAVAVDSSGNVVVAGVSDNGANTDYYTAKYAAADGALLWEKRYNGPANGNDGVLTSRSLALGTNGLVAVTGSSGGDYATVVYRENLPPVSIDLIPAGPRLRFTGVAGRSYTIERAPAVTGPWTSLATPTAPIGGLIEYVDTNPPVDTAFYRTSTL